jgi:hypothetical protein
LNTAADALSRLGEPPFVPVEMTAAVPDSLVVDGHPTPGGGDSIFVSLYRLLARRRTNLPKDTLELRKQLINDLLNHPTSYKLKLERESRRKLRSMCYKDVLPSFDVLLAASKLYKVQIFVYFWSEQPVIYRWGEFEDVIHLQCLGGIHFNALVPLQSFKNPECNMCTQVNCDQTYNIVAHSTENDLCDYSDGEEQLVKHLLNVDAVQTDPNISCVHGNYNFTQPQVTVRIGGYNFCAMIDTGAELSLVSDNVLTRLKLNSVPFIENSENLCSIIGLSGVKTPITKTVMLRFSLGSITMNSLFKFAVVTESIFPQCFLIGLDFLYQFNINVNLNERILTDKTCAVANMTCNSS